MAKKRHVALADGVELLEVEFPPLLETKTQFDDFSNVEVHRGKG